MKLKTILAGLAMLVAFSTNAQSIGDIFGKITNGSSGNILGNVLDGVFSSSNITVADIAGDYVSTGPAVTFKSENFLQKAGGIAGAAAIESKLDPYYNQYGLTGATLEIDKDANFSMKVKGIPLKGTITKNDGDGTFNFNLVVMGIKLGSFTAYIEKSVNSIKVMFDADKLLKIISTVAKFTGNSIASTMGSLLDSYDGACIGFKMNKTGNSSTNSYSTPAESSNSSSSSNQSSGLGGILNILQNNR